MAWFASTAAVPSCGAGARRVGRCVARASAVAMAPGTARTHYEVLGVGAGASRGEIKAAYRRAARRWHPDACPGGADRFMAAREAYEVLSDPERRRGYDIQLRCGGFGGAGDSGYRAARRAGFADWEAQLAGLQWRAAERRGRAGGETWGSRMRRAAA